MKGREDIHLHHQHKVWEYLEKGDCAVSPLTFPAEISKLAMIWQLHVWTLPSCFCYIFLQKSDGRGEVKVLSVSN